MDEDLPFPVPPRPSWWARNAVTLREAGLGTVAFGCAIGAFGLGGDMTLTIIMLSLGFALGSIALLTAPQKSFTWKLLATVLLFVFFAMETGFLYWHFHILKHETATQVTQPTTAPSKQALPPEASRTTSTNGRAVYNCSQIEVTDHKIIEKKKAEFKKDMAIYADTFGLSIKVSDVLGGTKVEITPATAVGQQLMAATIKSTYEVRRIGKNLLGIYTGEFSSGLFQTLAAFQLIPDSENEKNIRQNIERIAGVEKGNCKLQ